MAVGSEDVVSDCDGVVVVVVAFLDSCVEEKIREETAEDAVEEVAVMLGVGVVGGTPGIGSASGMVLVSYTRY